MNFWLRISSILTLVGLALIIWPLFDRTLIPIMVGMSVAQGIGTLAFGCYAFVVIKDIRSKYVRRKSMESIPTDGIKTTGDKP